VQLLTEICHSMPPICESDVLYARVRSQAILLDLLLQAHGVCIQLMGRAAVQVPFQMFQHNSDF
jgi:hypothetical protein